MLWAIFLTTLVQPAAPVFDAGIEGPVAAEVVETEVVETEGESELAGPQGETSDGALLYSADVSDEELETMWQTDASALGTISVGFTEAGRLINGIQMPPGPTWSVIAPENAWGTRETVDGLIAAATAVHEQYPTCGPLRINHIGKKGGGYLRPHQSHQSGRDVDVGFFYKDPASHARPTKARELLIDAAENFALLKALVMQTDVQMVLVDRRVQKVLFDWALSHGEDRGWLESLFHAGFNSLVQHARGHRDHFHVRFFSPRSQELGRRVQPLLSKLPEHNVLIHRVQKGDTLGRIAIRYGSTVSLIQRANGLSNTALRVGRTLNVPLRGPCTNCPVPPPLRVPPRRLPPEPVEADVEGEPTRSPT